MTISRVTGILLILVPIAFNLVFFLLQRHFEYPDILRKPTDYILTRFRAGGSRLVALRFESQPVALPNTRMQPDPRAAGEGRPATALRSEYRGACVASLTGQSIVQAGVRFSR